MEELLKKLNIELDKASDSDTYIINNYDEFSYIYNELDKSDLVSRDSDESFFNLDEAHVVFYNSDYDIIMDADLNEDIYGLKITENNDNEKE